MKRRQGWKGHALHRTVGTVGLGDNADPNYRVSSAPSPSPRSNYFTWEPTLQERLVVVKHRNNFALRFKELKKQGAGRGIRLTGCHMLPLPTAPLVSRAMSRRLREARRSLQILQPELGR